MFLFSHFYSSTILDCKISEFNLFLDYFFKFLDNNISEEVFKFIGQLWGII
ncbi:MAG: hypothetical protein BAJALOKI2v1_480027 [Promethearchaeota archaeon]|nr:MAG: hypothetical protein BAJALOKI2v1_480027 [Candidatus Lokiarchaeota archaeon]